MYNFFASRQYENQPLRDLFRSLFPRGVRLTLVGNEVIDMVPESYKDVWACGQPGVSTTLMMDPVCTDFLPIQDVLNNLTALNQESIERGIPIVAADPNVLNVDAINSRAGVPGELIAAEPGAGGRLKDSVINLPTAKYEPDVQNFSSMMLEIGRQLTGVMPPIFGGGDSGTAREADINKTQALMQLGIIWLGALSAWKGAYTNGVKMISQFGGEVLRRFGLSDMDLQKAPMLVDPMTGDLNGFTIEVEESIPATWGQKKDSLMFMLQGGPDVMQVTGAADPANADKVQDIMGVPDWKTPGSGTRNFILIEIKQLLSSGPQAPPPEIDPLTGQPLPPDPAAPLMPSIMPDPVVVEPMVALMIVRDWLTSDEGILQREANPEGWDNVRLYAQQLMMMSAPPPPPPGEEGEPPAPEEPPMEEPMPAPGSMGPVV